MLEILRLESYGMDKAYIKLSEYAIKESVKCSIANIGDIITPESFQFSGNPVFPYELFVKYSKGDHYANIYVEVKYDVKELELPEYVYDDVDGINSFVQDLANLHLLIGTRSVAYNKKGLKLKEFIWRGKLCFDQFGQVRNVYDQEWKCTDEVRQFVQSCTLSVDRFHRYCDGWTSSFKGIPNAETTCPVCGYAWTLDNMDDYITRDEEYVPISYHNDCFKEQIANEQWEEFRNILSQVYDIKDCQMTEIPNEYCKCIRCAPWNIFKTPDGDIKIGWRRSVIEIEWQDNYKPFTETFESENVTKSFGKHGSDKEKRYIHAHGVEKTVEYLKRAKDSI